MIKYPFIVKKFFIPVSVVLPFSLLNFNKNYNEDINHKKYMDKIINIIQLQRM